MNNIMKLFALLVFAVVLSACSTTPTVTTPGQATESKGKQNALTLDDEFLMVNESTPGFAGLHYNDQGELVVSIAPTGLTTQSVEDMKTDLSSSLTQVFGENILNALPSENTIASLEGGLSVQSLAVPKKEIKIASVKYEFKQLSEWYNQVEDIAWEIEGVLSTDIDEVSNKVFIGVENQSAQQALESALATLNLPNDVLAIEIDEVVSPDVSLRDKHRPLLGGIEIQTRNGGFCTMGFNAIRNGVNGFVTNSHCTRDQYRNTSDSIRQGGRVVGVEHAEAPITMINGRPYRWADVAFIRYSNQNPGMMSLGSIANAGYKNPNIMYSNSTKIDFKSYSPKVGQRIYKVGRTTGRTTGKIVRTCTNSRSSTSGIINRCQSRARTYDGQAISQGGDSGSPVYAYHYVSGVGYKIELLGINWGSSGSGWSSELIFSPMANIQWALSANLRVHPVQKTGEKLRVTLRYVRVHDDCDDTWGNRVGEIYGQFKIDGSTVYTLPQTNVRGATNLGIWKYRNVTTRYDDAVGVNISGYLKESDYGPDDDVGKWNINLRPVPSSGYFSNYSNPDCDSTLYYHVRDIGNTWE